MGTSLPELTVSISAAFRGASDLAIGNVVGSNIFNIGVVLGLTAVLNPIRVHSSAVRIGRTEIGTGAAADFAEEVERRDVPDALQSTGKALLLIGAGVGLLVVGGEVLLRGAVDLARAAGMSERLIGLTIVAAGTGTPELATSLMAARRGQSEIARGNMIGSNIFNILAILGVVSIVRPVPVPPVMVANDMVWMLGFAA